MGPTVKNGDKIKLHYKAIYENEVLFDTTLQPAPMEITVGKDEIIPSFEKALLGMKPGEKKSIFIAAKDAFGPYQEELVSEVQKEQLPEDLKVEIGQMLQIQQPNGSSLLVTVKDISPHTVTFDANHPLAGKDLTFDIELVAII